MKLFSILTSLSLLTISTEISAAADKVVSKRQQQQQQDFQIVVNLGAKRGSGIPVEEQGHSTPLTYDSIGLSCKKAIIYGHFQKEGGFQVRLELVGDVQITGKDLSATAVKVLLKIDAKRFMIQSKGDKNVILWWSKKDKKYIANRIDAKQVEFDFSSSPEKASKIERLTPGSS